MELLLPGKRHLPKRHCQTDTRTCHFPRGLEPEPILGLSLRFHWYEDGTKRYLFVDPEDGEEKERQSGCRARYTCCQEDPDGGGSGGCQPRYACCGGRPDAEGCVLQCRKCGRRWGSPADGCTRREHNTVDEWEEDEDEEKEEGEGNNNDVESLNLPQRKERPRYILGLQPLVLEKPF